ncbi:amino acid permease-domain-containing protein [Echria macrotheca]|uniref:Amino acid permease-domain-containing protein n=1 Tax=Echria macrotheca TaxID=438768 RepID=A0AAJ0B1U2_9PEZI|nr:amino acid permease-domain-containing protein [Echria macrotheca]
MSSPAGSGASTPLLSSETASPPPGYQSIRKSSDSIASESVADAVEVHRSIEDDVLPETAVVGRNLGWSSAFVIIISRVIGSGIFATPGAITSSVGSIGLSLLLWVAGALISWCGLAISLEYGCMLPRSGGEKVYLEFTYRRPRFLASTLMAVQAIVLGFTASNCIVFGEYVLFALGKTPQDHKLDVRLLAVGLMTVITIIHGCFLKTGIAIQNALGWVKILLVVFMILASAVVVATGYQATPGSGTVFPRTWDGIWEGSVWNWGVISTALFKVFYSYAGLQNVNNVLNEVRDPVRTLKSAATTALVASCILYFLINVAYFLVVPLDEIKHSGELIAALFFERTFGSEFGAVFLPLAVAVSAVGNVMVVTFSLARLNQEIARQGFLPFSDFLSSTRPFGAPLGGLIVHYIPSAIVICVPADNIYSFILDVEAYPGQFFALATSFGLIWLRWKRPDLKRPYKAFLPAVWLRIVLSLALVAAPFVPRQGEDAGAHLFRVTYALVGISVILFGVLYWLFLAILLPRWGGYKLEETADVLKDGTTVTKFTRPGQPHAGPEGKHHVNTVLNYYLEAEDGSPPPPTYVDQPQTYFRPTKPLNVTVHDVTGDEANYNLDNHGFQIYKHESREKEFVDDEKIKAEYYPETEQLLKDATGASRIFIFDHTIRRQQKDRRASDGPPLRGPVERVHIDQSYEASLSRVAHHLPDEAEELLKNRVQIINVWRPIKQIFRSPLAVASAPSVPDSDLVPVALIYPNRRGETYTVRPNPQHKWFFKYAQRPDEVTLIKCFDSRDDGSVARRVPHSAFVDPAEEDKEPRESIEVRALVFYDSK